MYTFNMNISLGFFFTESFTDGASFNISKSRCWPKFAMCVWRIRGFVITSRYNQCDNTCVVQHWGIVCIFHCSTWRICRKNWCCVIHHNNPVKHHWRILYLVLLFSLTILQKTTHAPYFVAMHMSNNADAWYMYSTVQHYDFAEKNLMLCNSSQQLWGIGYVFYFSTWRIFQNQCVV